MIRIQRTVAPTLTALDVATARAWLKLDAIDGAAIDQALDAEITALVAAAVDHIEAETARVLLPSTWRISYPAWPVNDCLDLPLAPVTVVSSIEYLDGLSALRTLHADNTLVTLDGDYPSITRAPGAVWPTLYASPAAVRVTVQAGYAAVAQIPPAITMALRLLLGHWFANRAAVHVGVSATELPMGVRALLDSAARVHL